MGIPQPAFYIFKCEQAAPPGMPKPSCVTDDNKGLYQYTAKKLMMEGVMMTAPIVRTSCMNRCAQGPVMLIEPGHTMYVDLTEEKIDRIIAEHIVGGKVVEEYVIAEEFWDEPMSTEAARKLMGK
ncbi:MAG: (2Fe-2S) ferredoxin domain-containing protein [Sulfurimonas sp.]|nr:(2Fe-2S) ferredoxin domain-containing protein [Sulfurimonas sp.]MDQ7061780.1 (2Fe-2S) ferredoxin domain-containing protein [Sulfurimonas sp.]